MGNATQLSENGVQEPRAGLEARLGRVTQQLASLNRELAGQMVLLADQTGDTRPLLGAVQALRRVKDSYSRDHAPRETAEVNAELADALFALGRSNDDVEALEHSVEAYRAAITLSSLLGDEGWRRDLRRRHDTAEAALRARAPIAA